MAKPWDQRESESDAAYAAFRVFLHTHGIPARNPQFAEIVKAQAGYELSPHYLGDLHAYEKWRERKRAYQSHLLNQRAGVIADALARDEIKTAALQTKVRRLAQSKAMRSLKQIELIADADVKDHVAYLGAIRQAIEIAGFTAIDIREQSRRLRSQSGTGGGYESSETEEVIPPIPPEPGCVQQSDPSEEGILGTPAGDLPGDSGPVHSDGPGDHG